MGKKQFSLLSFMIYLLILVVFSVTIYFCLDVLEIIDVPKEYSLVSLLEGYLGDTTYDYKQNLGETTNEIVKTIGTSDSNSSRLYSEHMETPNLNSTTNLNTAYEPISNAASFSYYEQLDNYGKIIYTELEKNLDNMKSGTYNVDFGTTFNDLLHTDNGEEILNNSFQLAINALNFDNPELFYIDISKLYLLTTITTKITGTTYKVAIGSSNGRSYLNSTFQNREQVEEAIARVEGQKKVIESVLSGTIEGQIRAVHDYLISYLEYDSTTSKDNIYNIYGALINRCTVCEGYARAFKAIMDDLKIPCLIACGEGRNSAGQIENHAWNYVKIDGKWYAIDVTWDDPIIIGNGMVSSDVNYKYYLKGSEEFFVNHTENGAIVGDASFQYPTLSRTNY